MLLRASPLRFFFVLIFVDKVTRGCNHRHDTARDVLWALRQAHLREQSECLRRDVPPSRKGFRELVELFQEILPNSTTPLGYILGHGVHLAAPRALQRNVGSLNCCCMSSATHEGQTTPPTRKKGFEEHLNLDEPVSYTHLTLPTTPYV